MARFVNNHAAHLLSAATKPRLTRRPIHQSAAKQVQVYVEDALPCLLATVHNHAVSVFRKALLPRYFFRGQHKITHQFLIACIEIVDCRNVPARNNQYMCRCLRIDIAKRYCHIGLINDIRGNISIDDSAKQAILTCHDSLLIDDAPAVKRVRQSSTVDVFEFATQRYAVGNTGGLNTVA